MSDALAEALAALDARTDTRNVPGHRDAGRDEWHFLNHGCLECDAHTLAGAPLGRVEDWYRNGQIGQVAYEAYMWAWTTSATRHGSHGDWTPVDDQTRDFAEMIRQAHKEQQHAAG